MLVFVAVRFGSVVNELRHLSIVDICFGNWSAYNSKSNSRHGGGSGVSV